MAKVAAVRFKAVVLLLLFHSLLLFLLFVWVLIVCVGYCAWSLFCYAVLSDLSFAFIYNAFNVYCRELAPGTVSLTGYRAQGDDSKHWAYCS